MATDWQVSSGAVGPERPGCQTRHVARTIRHVAFLGGINVGGHRVTMDRLRDEVTRLGFRDVSTFIASGNVMFNAPPRPDHDDHLAQGLETALGWPVPTFVRTAAELTAAVDMQPFGEVPTGHTYAIVFCRTEPSPEVESLSTEHERFEVHGAEVHWLIDGGLMSSAIGLQRLPKVLGQPCTTRNTNSLCKLADLLR
jgi:uncharacterized protein (DUF1697 family)